MKTTVTCSDFVDAFRHAGREDQFTVAGRKALFDYLEELENDTGTELELDVIALCCDYSEYPNALAAAKDMSSFDPDAEADGDEQEQAALEYLRDNTQVIEFDGGIIIASF